MTPIKSFLPAMALLALFIVFFACNSPQERKQAAVATANVDHVASDTSNSCLINGELPVLWIEATEFLKLKGQAAFRFYIDGNKDLTLSAWNKPFDNNPSVFTLKTSILSTVQASSGNYLGNLILSSSDRGDIERRIKTEGWTKVKFIPVLATGSNEAGQVTYIIVLTNDSMPPRPLHARDSLFMLRDTSSVVPPGGYELNPSPPRNE